MTITVLLAPDGSRVWAALGKHSLWSAADLMEAVSRGEALPAQATYIANHGVTFEAFVWDNEIRELAPGYRLEHHDLAELLARPTAAEPGETIEMVRRAFALDTPDLGDGPDDLCLGTTAGRLVMLMADVGDTLDALGCEEPYQRWGQINDAHGFIHDLRRELATAKSEIETHKVAIKNLRWDLLHCKCGQ